MQRCGKQYGVFLDGKWVWYHSYQAARAAETADLGRRLAARLAEKQALIVPAEWIGQGQGEKDKRTD